MGIVLIILAGIVIAMVINGSKMANKRTCDELGYPHKWRRVYHNETDYYLVCKNCKMLPGGQIEERDDYGN